MMKLTFKLLAIVFIVFAINTSIKAQKLFSGTIVYDITYSGAEIDPATAATLPKNMTMTILGKKSRVDMQQGPMNISKINNAETMLNITLLNVMGQKYAIKQTKEQIMKGVNKMPKAKVTVTDETKVIAGKKATKAIVVFTDEDGVETTEEVYYASEIGGENFNFDTPYRGINGGLLEYTIQSGDIIMKYTATEVKSKKIKDTSFLIPTDYQEVSAEELMEIFGGMAE